MVVEIKYPGASPRDSEINAVIPIEEKLSSIPGIKNTVSLSVENGGTVYVYLDPDVKDIKSVKDQIYRDISRSTEGVSTDVDEINIIDINPKRMTVFSLALIYDDFEKMTEKQFYAYSDYIESKIKKTEGVGEVRVSGFKNREIKIKVNPYKLQTNYVSLNELTKSIQNRNVRSTGGSLQSIQEEQNIVTIGEFENPMEVSDVIIRSTFEHPALRIKNIAEVEDSFEKQAVMVRVNKKPGIVFSVVKKENSDIVKTVDNLKTLIKKETKNVPDGVKLSSIEDRSLSIRSLLSVVASNAIIGFLLVFIILLFFLDLKTAFWTAFGIPTTLLMLFTFFNIMDYSLNLITLGAVITVLGMLVDHGIVISESVYTFKKQGLKTSEAALKGVTDVLSPVLITILTTIAAFLPLLYVGGVMGKFIKVYPVIISAALILSFMEAVFILPGHLAHSKDKKIKKESKNRFEIFSGSYKKLLLKLFPFRYAVLAFFIFLLGFSVFLAKDNIRNFVLMWDNTADSFLVNLEAPEGTSLEKTSELAVPLEEMINKSVKKNELFAVKTNIGHHTVKRINSQGNHENWAQIAVYLVPNTERNRTVEQIMNAVKTEFKNQKDTVKKFRKITFSKMTVGPSSSGMVELKLIGGSAEEKTDLFNKIRTFMKELPGVVDFDTDQKPGKSELKIVFNYEALAKLELNVLSVAQTVKTAFDGTVSTSIQTEKEKIDFRVMIDNKFTRDISFLENLLIPNAKGRLIRLNQVASIETGTGPAIINHFNGSRVITITSRVDKQKTTANSVSSEVRKFFSSIPDKNKNIKLIIKGEAEDTAESLADLKFSFIMALILIYFLLLLLFKKSEQPLIVILTIPFGIIGVLLAFYFHGIPLSFMALVGMIGLSGVVVNDSVVMVAFINNLMKSSNDTAGLKEDIAEGAKQRLRPIVLTTLTTVAGLLPSVYGIGGDVQSLVPAVMALSYGLIFATLVTLFLVPVLFLIIRDIKGVFIKSI